MAYLHRIEVHRAHRNLRPFSLAFAPEDGEFQHLIITGPNGSGKSSLLAAPRSA